MVLGFVVCYCHLELESLLAKGNLKLYSVFHPSQILDLPIDSDSMNSNQPTIYCDMDCVLCDFWSSAKRLTSEPIETWPLRKIWEIIAQYPNFWSDLEQLPQASELWDYVNSRNGHILSSLAYTDPNSRPGKLKWLKLNFQFSDSERIHLTDRRRDKQKFATTNGVANILIDDYRKNITEWEEAGGIGILHTNVDETIERVEKILKIEWHL